MYAVPAVGDVEAIVVKKAPAIPEVPSNSKCEAVGALCVDSERAAHFTILRSCPHSQTEAGFLEKDDEARCESDG